MVYKRIRGWTAGRSLPVLKNCGVPPRGHIIIFVVPSYVWISIELSVLQSNDLFSEGEDVYDTGGALNSLKIVLFASFVPRYDTNLFISFLCVKGQNNKSVISKMDEVWSLHTVCGVGTCPPTFVVGFAGQILKHVFVS